jgi:hypothetical protein
VFINISSGSGFIATGIGETVVPAMRGETRTAGQLHSGADTSVTPSSSGLKNAMETEVDGVSDSDLRVSGCDSISFAPL